MGRSIFVFWVFCVAVIQAATPIPEEGGSGWDFRGTPHFSNPEYEKLYTCKTYEELRDQLVKAIKSIAPGEGAEWEDASQANAVATCQLALTRTLYILRDFDEADRLLGKLHPVHEGERWRQSEPSRGDIPPNK